MNLLPPALE